MDLESPSPRPAPNPSGLGHPWRVRFFGSWRRPKNPGGVPLPPPCVRPISGQGRLSQGVVPGAAFCFLGQGVPGSSNTNLRSNFATLESREWTNSRGCRSVLSPRQARASLEKTLRVRALTEEFQRRSRRVRAGSGRRVTAPALPRDKRIWSGVFATRRGWACLCPRHSESPLCAYPCQHAYKTRPPLSASRPHQRPLRGNCEITPYFFM